jgi:hypothetical protein
MKLVKIPKREWANYRVACKPHHYLARVFNEDTEQLRIVVDEQGVILGGVSYSIEVDHVHVYSLQSLVPGAGSRLMDHVERRAQRLGLPVRLASEKSAVGFYERRGYRKLPSQKSTDRIFFMRLGVTSG